MYFTFGNETRISLQTLTFRGGISICSRLDHSQKADGGNQMSVIAGTFIVDLRPPYLPLMGSDLMNDGDNIAVIGSWEMRL